jgi:8-oxo-dGTP diphosphatase
MEVLTDVNERDPAVGFRPLVQVALVALGVADGQILVLLRETPTGWELPRRNPREAEALDAAAALEAVAYFGDDPYLEQLCTWENPAVQASQRVVEVGYLALTVPRSREDEGVEWRVLHELPPLPESHARIIRYAHERLQRKLSYTNVAWSLLDAEFTLSEMQQVYEAVVGRVLDKRNFRKWVLGNGMVEPTPRERRDGAHRPARLYRFPRRELCVLE